MRDRNRILELPTDFKEILHIYIREEGFLQLKNTASTWSCENPLSDLATDYPPDAVQLSYRVPSKEKCFVSLDLAKTLEHENPTLLPSQHALPRAKSYPDFKQQYLLYLKAPPDETKGQNP